MNAVSKKNRIVAITLLIAMLCVTSCRTEKKGSVYEYVNVAIEDLSGKKIEALLIRNIDDPDKNHMMAVIGDIDRAERILGHEISAEKVIDPSWIDRLVSGFIEADRVKQYLMDDSEIIFLTKEKGYVLKISADDKVVYGPDYQSEQIRKDFAEMGLLDMSDEPVDMNEVIKGLRKYE